MELIFIILIMFVIVGVIGPIINPKVTFWQIFIVFLIAGLGLFLIINSLSLFFINYSFIT